MVVTAGAGDCYPQQRAGDRIDLLVDDVRALFFSVLLGVNLDSHGKVGGGRQPPVGDGRIRRGWQQVAGELFADKLIEGTVLVEGIDDVVAIVVGEGIGLVLIGAIGVGVAHHVEPVSSPAFTIVR